MFASSFGSNFLQIGFFSDALRISLTFFWLKVFDLFNLISFVPILLIIVVCLANAGVLGDFVDFFVSNKSSLVSSETIALVRSELA